VAKVKVMWGLKRVTVTLRIRYGALKGATGEDGKGPDNKRRRTLRGGQRILRIRVDIVIAKLRKKGGERPNP